MKHRKKTKPEKKNLTSLQNSIKWLNTCAIEVPEEGKREVCEQKNNLKK